MVDTAQDYFSRSHFSHLCLISFETHKPEASRELKFILLKYTHLLMWGNEPRDPSPSLLY